MLPGVEHARRRSFHQRGGNNWLNSTSISSFSSPMRYFCYDQYHLNSNCSKQRSVASHAYQDEELVEIARKAKQRLDSAHWISESKRRRFHQRSGNNWLNSPSSTSSFSSIRRSFCLYASNYDQHHLSSNSSKQRSAESHAYQVEELDEIARKAKQRLDQRFNALCGSESKRSMNNRQQKQGVVDIRSILRVVELHRVFGLKKCVSKSVINWAKLRWKSPEQDVCVICLDQFKIMGGNLMQLPCAHRFHSKCLVPWLECNANCPCCRMENLTTP